MGRDPNSHLSPILAIQKKNLSGGQKKIFLQKCPNIDLFSLKKYIVLLEEILDILHVL